ncbi:hypothetical protein vBAmePPT11V19_00006 [Alteromonas phage vB_AmeP_PT11-V19]|nr:hypothetical protein vBAmePPT11V19_00006 [Alteromonas phage vB_AmeP_PT11-V19]
MKIQKKIDAGKLREQEYLPAGDQFDAIIKTFDHLKSQGIDIGTEGENLVESSKKVKQKYPK